MITNLGARRTGWYRDFYHDVMPALAAAHEDLTGIVAALRNSTQYDFWTENPTDQGKLSAGKTAVSFEGLRDHYSRLRARLNAWMTTNGTALQAYDPVARTAALGLITSIAAIGTTFNQIVAAYTDPNGNLLQTKISQTHRNTLADAIAAQLEAA